MKSPGFRKSFIFAIKGIVLAWKQERNFRTQLVIAAIVVTLSVLLAIPLSHTIVAVAMIGLVMTAEMMNTAFEELCDKFYPEHDPHIGRIKDLAAGAVLIASITAAIVGIAIFAPAIIALV